MLGSGQRAQRWEAQVALAENKNSVPRTHVAAHSHLQLWLQETCSPFRLSGRPKHACGAHTLTHNKNTHIFLKSKILDQIISNSRFNIPWFPQSCSQPSELQGSHLEKNYKWSPYCLDSLNFKILKYTRVNVLTLSNCSTKHYFLLVCKCCFSWQYMFAHIIS